MLDRPAERGPHVPVLRLEPPHPVGLPGPAQHGLAGTGEFAVRDQMAQLDRRALARLGEPLGGVLRDGLKQPVAHRVAVRGRHDQGLVDEGGEQAEHVGGVLRRVGGIGADRLRLGQREAAGEDGEAAQHGPLARVQELPRPVDHGPQGLLPGPQRPAGAGAVAEEAEPVVEAVRELARGEHPQPGGGEFEGEGQPVEAAADLGGGLRVLGHAEVRPGRRAALAEQPQGGVQGQGSHSAHPLPRDAEGFPAGGEDGDAGAAGEQFVCQLGGPGGDLLAVVEDEQHPAVAAVRDEPFQRVAGPGLGGGEQHALARAERGEQGLRQLRRLPYGREFGQPDAVGPRVGDGLRGLQGEPGLARAAGAGEGDEPGVGQIRAQGEEFRLASDEGGEAGAEVAGAGAPSAC